MDRRGGYRKTRDNITSPVTRVPKGAAEAPRHPDAPVPRPHESSSGVFFVNKTAGWALAALFITILIAIAYIGSAIFTREHQFEHLRDQQKQMRQELDTLKTKNRGLEMRMVEMNTHLENLEDSSD